MQVEKKYGGKLEDLVEYWPPRYLGDATDTLDDDTIISHGIVPFSFDQDDFESATNIVKSKEQPSQGTIFIKLGSPTGPKRKTLSPRESEYPKNTRRMRRVKTTLLPTGLRIYDISAS